MNRRLLNVLLVAFVIAAGASFLVYRLVRYRMAGGHAAMTRVVAAAADIPLGVVLQSKDLTWINVSGTPPKGALLNESDALGRGVVSSLYAGEPIVDNRLAPRGSGGGLAATIPTGMRAAAVKVNDVVGVAGFATPGMRVDVLITGTPPGTQENTGTGTRVRTLLQNIEVLSAGSDIQRDNDGKPHSVQVVNLLVTPQQAELLSLASNETKIQLVLRNPLDTQVEQANGAAMNELFGAQLNPTKPAAPIVVHRAKAPVQHLYLVEVFNGSKQSEAKFQSGEEKQ